MQTNIVLKKRPRVRNFLALACILIIVAIGAYSAYRLLNTANDTTIFNSVFVKSPAREGQTQTALYERKIYPYSIVRGGMRSREEVYANIRTDHVVAEHYSGFDVDKTRVIQAPETRSMYVSYRLGDEVYWTAKAVQIPRGETLITDGTIEARARCGNRLSATPMTPTSDKEPDVASFDIPENEIPGYFEPFEPADPSIEPEQPQLTTIGDIDPYLPGPPTFWSPGPPSGGGTIDPPDVSSLPEPGTMVMLLTGLAVVAVIRIRLLKQ